MVYRWTVRTPTTARSRSIATYPRTSAADRCRRKFLRRFPKGSRDEPSLDGKRDYKGAVHEEWQQLLSRAIFGELLEGGRFAEAAGRALKIEQRARHSM